MKNFSIIVAVDQKGGIGKSGKLPWHLPADLQHFARSTKGGTVIMGRNTWESIPRNFRPLKERLNIVLTGNLNYEVDNGVRLASSIDGALAVSQNDTFVIGGAKLFEDAIKHKACEKLIVTKILDTFDCDTFFPFIPVYFEIISESEVYEDSGIKYKFVTYENKML